MPTKDQCAVHGIDLVKFCPACRGETKSKKKAASSRENGKLGGRPASAKKRKVAKKKKR